MKDVQNVEMIGSSSSIKDSQGTNHSCRICLLNGFLKYENKLVSPCQCQGSLKYVHEGCLREWIQQKLKNKQKLFLKRQYQCQICQHWIPFEFQRNYTLNQLQTIKEAFQTNRHQVVVKTITFFIQLLVICLLITFSSDGTINFSPENTVIFAFCMVGFVSLSTMMILLLLDFLYHIVIKRVRRIKKIIDK